MTSHLMTTAGWNNRAALLEDARIGTSRIEINGELTPLKTAVLKDEGGNEVNYVKLRDVATVLNTTSAQFNVGWEKSVTTIQPHTSYTTTNGSELQAPDASNAKLSDNPSSVFVEGIIAPIESFLLTAQDGGGHTYFKLRDLGKILNFDVTWDGVSQIVHIVTATK